MSSRYGSVASDEARTAKSSRPSSLGRLGSVLPYLPKRAGQAAVRVVSLLQGVPTPLQYPGSARTNPPASRALSSRTRKRVIRSEAEALLKKKKCRSDFKRAKRSRPS